MSISGSDPEESQQSLVGGLEHVLFSIYIYIYISEYIYIYYKNMYIYIYILGVIIPTDPN